MKHTSDSLDVIIHLLNRMEKYEDEVKTLCNNLNKIQTSTSDLILNAWLTVLKHLESQECKSCANHLIKEGKRNGIF